MKKIYTSLFLLALCITGKAQYTITSASNPVIGDIQRTWNLDTAGLVMGTAGASQTWNFTNISISPTTAVLTQSYVSPSASPSASLFPSANIAQTSGGIYMMFANSATSSVYYGINSGTFNIVYGDPQLVNNLPFSYGSNCSDTYSTSYVSGGVTIVQNGTVTATGDGYGTLNTPGNSYSNVLRIRYTNYEIQTITPGGTSTITGNTYLYINALSKFALLSLSNYTNNSGTFSSTGKSGAVLDVVLSGIKQQSGQADFSMFPNPAVNKEVILNFNLLNSENYTASIYNSIGQKVMEADLGEKNPGAYHEKIDLNGLQSGIYFVKLKGKNSQGVQKLIVE